MAMNAQGRPSQPGIGVRDGFRIIGVGERSASVHQLLASGLPATTQGRGEQNSADSPHKLAPALQNATPPGAGGALLGISKCPIISSWQIEGARGSAALGSSRVISENRSRS